MYTFYDIDAMFERVSTQNRKEAYIVNMLIRTLYSNNVNNSECYRIVKKFEEEVLGYTLDEYIPEDN